MKGCVSFTRYVVSLESNDSNQFGVDGNLLTLHLQLQWWCDDQRGPNSTHKFYDVDLSFMLTCFMLTCWHKFYDVDLVMVMLIQAGGKFRLRRADAEQQIRTKRVEIRTKRRRIKFYSAAVAVAQSEVYGFLHSMQTVSSWTVNDIWVNRVPALIPAHSHWALAITQSRSSHIWLVKKRNLSIVKTETFDWHSVDGSSSWVGFSSWCSQILRFLASP